MAKQKYYVVWDGVSPGVYTSWTECQLKIKGYEGAKYKSFNTKEEAEVAFQSNPYKYIGMKKQGPTKVASDPNIIRDSLAVDAACSGNPGPMEYRGVYIQSGQEIFHFGPTLGTNNIGEFLAIVHALALLKQNNLTTPIYTDSRIAMGWVKEKKCKTQLVRNAITEELYKTIERAENWLKNNSYATKIMKWETKEWGEIPADFGRK